MRDYGICWGLSGERGGASSMWDWSQRKTPSLWIGTHCGGVGGNKGGELKEREDGRRPSQVLGLTFLLHKLFHKIV